MKINIISDLQIYSFDQLKAHAYFVIEGRPDQVFIKLEAPGAFLMMDGGVQFSPAAFFNGKQLRRILVRAVTIEPRKPDTTELTGLS